MLKRQQSSITSKKTKIESQVNLKSLSSVQLFATPWTVARQAPLSIKFSRQEYWSGLLCPPPGDLHPGMEPAYPASPTLASGFFTASTTWGLGHRLYYHDVKWVALETN